VVVVFFSVETMVEAINKIMWFFFDFVFVHKYLFFRYDALDYNCLPFLEKVFFSTLCICMLSFASQPVGF
jgi:hypothetical protein